MRLAVLGVMLFAMAAEAETKIFPQKGADYQQYKTYRWLPPRLVTRQGIVDEDERVAPMIRRAVNAELQKRGLTEVPAGSAADLEVLTAAVERGGTQLQAIFLGYAWDVYWGVGVPVVPVFNQYNREGVLGLGLIDTKTKKGVYVGFDSEGLGRPEQAEGILRKAAGKVLKKYPSLKK